MPLDFQRPTGKPASESDKLSMAELGGEEEMVEGEEEAPEGEDDLGFFTEQEAMKKLEALGFIIQPPEGAEGDDMDEFVESEPSVPIVGSN